uniref:Coiled coil helix coiled coil helix n=1 Tax=Echinococcus granulosus TaxID=6210 RepID=A0A068WJ44_ECHGR|nr:coiled coil helix coiled coil helix [Echinococcus granulosus]
MSGHVYKPVVPTDEDEDEDPVIKMIKHTGCLDEHNAIMECMFEHKDWRKCQDKVKLFRDLGCPRRVVLGLIWMVWRCNTGFLSQIYLCILDSNLVRSQPTLQHLILCCSCTL